MQIEKPTSPFKRHASIGITVAVSMFAAMQASAAAVTILSYDLTNGGTSSLATSLKDDTYTGGTGNRATNYSQLAGGKGDLTDGLVATGNWNNTPLPYVGWAGNVLPSPVVTFHLGTRTDITFVGIDMNWGYSPASVDFSVDGSPWINRGVTLPAPTGPNFRAGFDNLGLTGDTLTVRLNDRPPFFYNATLLQADWILVSEFTIEGMPAPIPEPHAWVMVLAGIGLLTWQANRARGSLQRATR